FVVVYSTRHAYTGRLYLSLHVMFFFFQAEDGIRDRNVTGVQTCALPIWKDCPPAHRAAGCPHRRMAPPFPAAPAGPGKRRSPWRSEERRVGKEYRAGLTATRRK